MGTYIQETTEMEFQGSFLQRITAKVFEQALEYMQYKTDLQATNSLVHVLWLS